MSAANNIDLSKAINESLLSIADGAPLAWFAKLAGLKRIERVAGFDLLKGLLESPNGLKHFLLGDTEKTINQVIKKARKKNNSLSIAGYSPPFKNQFSEDDNILIFEKINNEDPDIIWVSFGGGKQEKWMHQNIHRLNRGIMAGVGAAFKFYTGNLYSPPKIIQAR